jgi:hypothetical protein
MKTVLVNCPIDLRDLPPPTTQDQKKAILAYHLGAGTALQLSLCLVSSYKFYK